MPLHCYPELVLNLRQKPVQQEGNVQVLVSLPSVSAAKTLTPDQLQLASAFTLASCLFYWLIRHHMTWHHIQMSFLCPTVGPPEPNTGFDTSYAPASPDKVMT